MSWQFDEIIANKQQACKWAYPFLSVGLDLVYEKDQNSCFHGRRNV
jgi:hypothetical protein